MSGTERPPSVVAAEIAPAVSAVGAGFMNDPVLGETGTRLGYEGIDFYLAGRAGVLGEVTADVAAAALVFFDVDTVRRSWNRSEGIQPRVDAAVAFAGCAAVWAFARLPEDRRWGRLADLAGRLCDAAPIAGAPLFAGWRCLGDPTDPRAAAAHHLNGLREHRGAAHAAAVIANGLDIAEAVQLRQPTMLALFGWPAVERDDEYRAEFTRRWQIAEDQTDEVVGSLYATLSEDELGEFATLVGDAHAASRRPATVPPQPAPDGKP